VNPDQTDSFRYWQIKMIHDHTFVDYPEAHKPFPEKITVTYVFSPDIGHYLCSQVKNYWLTVVDSDLVWPEGVEPSEEHAEMWEEVLHSISPENDYFVARSLIRDWREGLSTEDIVFTKAVIESEYLGEFPDVGGDCGGQAALESACEAAL
jgi:hypothetical protein